MKILIIGGTGLMSTGITRFLMERGDEVTHYNRGITPSQISVSPKRITGDRRDYKVFEKQMAGAGNFDVVIDMICYEPQDAESAQRAFRGKVGQYILCSTVEVYTKFAKRYPVGEDEERRPAESYLYAVNKVKCEDILLGAYRSGDFPLTIIRPAMTYGEGKSFLNPFFAKGYIDRIRKGKPLIVHGDGNSVGVVCHRDDVARAFVAAVGNSKTFGKAYNVTGDEWISWNRFHRGIAEAMNAPSPRLVYIPTDLLGKIAPKRAFWCVENFQFNNIYDNSAAKNELGFCYTITWTEGARRTIDWLDKHGQIENSDNDPEYELIIEEWERLKENIHELKRKSH
jgi:nucleoside-diphosphate-sugar epimerase